MQSQIVKLEQDIEAVVCLVTAEDPEISRNWNVLRFTFVEWHNRPKIWAAVRRSFIKSHPLFFDNANLTSQQLDTTGSIWQLSCRHSKDSHSDRPEVQSSLCWMRTFCVVMKWTAHSAVTSDTPWFKMKILLKPFNLYSAVKPLYIVSKLLGLAPLGLKSMAESPEHFKGSAGLIGTVGSVLYSITILFIFVTLHCVCVYITR